MKICVYGAASNEIDREYIDVVEDFGEKMAKKGHELVFGGGARGLMGAAARGVTKGGGRITGISPSFFNVDGVLYDKCDDFIYTQTMRERKKLLEDSSDAFVIVPGGVGTFDEFFEVLCLRQLGLHEKPIAVFNINGYYDDLENLLKGAVSGRFMNEKNLNLVKFACKTEQIIEYLEGYTAPDDDVSVLRG